MGEDHPTIGLVIPAHNRAHVIDEALRSVAGLGLDEVTVVDDGSTDALQEVVSGYPWAKLVSQSRQGAAAARNRGVSELSTEFVSFLDSDDELLPSFLPVMRSEASEADIVCAAVYRCRRGDTQRSYEGPRPLGPSMSGYEGLFLAGSYVVRRSLFEDVGGFDPTMPAAQHTEFAMRLLHTARERELVVVSVKDPVAIYNVGETDGIRGDRVRVGRGAALLLSKHRDLLLTDPRKMAGHAAVAGTGSLLEGDVASARRYFLTAAKLQPRDPRAWARLMHTVLPVPVRRWVRALRRRTRSSLVARR